MYTSGALILSDDGDFIYKVTHPKYEIEKTYIVTLKGEINTAKLDKLRSGVEILVDGMPYKTGKAIVNLNKYDQKEKISKLEITIHEGKNREVRKMCEKVDLKVLALHRSKIGNISVKNLKIGTWRYLNKNEVQSLISKTT